MLSKIPLRIAGAAMLGTVALLGTNAANAGIDLDADSKRDAVVTYAMETVTESVTGEDGGMYYMVSNAENSMDTYGEVGVGGVSGTVRTINFTLNGMVFTSTSNPQLVGGADETAVTSEACTDPAGDGSNLANKRAGGGKGQNMVSFILTGTLAPNSDDHVCLLFDNIAVSADGGGISMRVMDNLPSPVMHDESHMGAVAFDTGLMIGEDVSKFDATASVAKRYMEFVPRDAVVVDTVTTMPAVTASRANMGGNISVSVNTKAFNAQTDLVLDANTAAAGTELIFALGADEVNGGSDGIDEDESTVVIMGDFSFAKSVTLDEEIACTTAGGYGGSAST